MRWILVFVVAFALLGPSLPLRAHGDADWIQNDPAFGWCCGPKDCERAPLGAVSVTSTGLLVNATGQVFQEGGQGVFLSKDEDWWWCWNLSAGTVRCLFVPRLGS